MVSSGLVDSLLDELGKALQSPGLHLDQNNTCLIEMRGVRINIEEKSSEYLLLGVDLGVLPPGRYRENIFREALKSNGLPFPRYGSFGFSKRSEKLILFETMRLNELSAEKIVNFLNPFIEKAKLWKDAIARGDVPLATTSTSGNKGMFGLMR